MKSFGAVVLPLLVLFFTTFPAAADKVYAGTCGKLDLYDDSDLDFRVFVVEPNDPAMSDLSAPGAMAQLFHGACLRIVSFQIHESDGGQWDCGIFLAQYIEDCSVGEDVKQNFEAWLSENRQHIRHGL